VAEEGKCLSVNPGVRLHEFNDKASLQRISNLSPMNELQTMETVLQTMLTSKSMLTRLSARVDIVM
jgi:hypothetical protein